VLARSMMFLIVLRSAMVMLLSMQIFTTVRHRDFIFGRKKRPNLGVLVKLTYYYLSSVVFLFRSKHTDPRVELQ